jgi:drug/metabolite transporter (DMT)-like permease
VDCLFKCEYIRLKIQQPKIQPIEENAMSSMKPSEWAMLVVLSVFWGGSFFFIEVALRGFQPFAIVFLRVVLAASILTGVVYLGGRRLPASVKVWGAYFVMGALNNAIPFSLIVWGQTRVASGVASILNATTPIFAVLLAHFLTSDEHLTLRRMMGVFIGFCGVSIMLQPELKDGFSWRGLGQVAVLGAAVSYGLAGIFGKRFKKASPVINAAGMLICSSVIMLPLVLTTGAIGLSRPNASAVAALCGLATVSTALAYLLYFRILATAGATNVLLVTFLIPVGALLLGVGVLGETIHILEYAGMGCIFLGLMVIDGRVFNGIKLRASGRQKIRFHA